MTAWKNEPWLIIDLETTGVPAEEHWPVEVGLVVYQGGEEVEHHIERLCPPVPIPEGAAAVHGITNDDVAGCPTIEEAAPRIVEILERYRVVVGYNGFGYDFPMLRDRCPGFYAACRGRVFIDPLVLVRMDDVGRYWRNGARANPDRGRHTLENAAAASGLTVRQEDLHGALGDCRLTAGILWRWRDRLPDDGRAAQRVLVDAREAQEAAFQAYKLGQA
jgi:DNA polymerase III epsilon subunit-like protein